MPGPVPKRSDQRRRRNKNSITKSAAGRCFEAPEPDEHWHPIARRLWEALTVSGQAQFYEASDWALAFSLMDDLSVYKSTAKRSAQMLQTIYSAFERLLIAEGDRRRVRLELERDTDDPEQVAKVAIMDRYRKAAADN
ncbi:hypothetical protein IU500_12375 [Nocardia terpenica]|uniref:phage terminase small subunit n=1 Tax=Nocardia terpenica TaxID=455432 RepID=UPI001894B9F0|nr:hypothetical protein [Nocardia terpenica]MBF6063027.1 hypothetical protein [Nocardia terpenica]MBF6104838.1 hypothetical protein [Nocardia terpenica]MBF6112725.1 hypothetical protein [Nocardia terpenica]MBF6118566.1 hypothetical protein [Nocardia terpenica]MBF6155045.1 hypothetical protein [Nocardia terpenica]